MVFVTWNDTIVFYAHLLSRTTDAMQIAVADRRQVQSRPFSSTSHYAYEQ